MISPNRTAEIAKSLLSKSFPELQKKHLQFRFVPDKSDDYYILVRKRLFGYNIFIRDEVRSFSEDALTGCIAHSLAQILLRENMPFLRQLRRLFRKKEYEEDQDIQAHSLVINRGLSRSLHQFLTEHKERHNPLRIARN